MTIKETSKNIIVVGSFNPAIFQPAWIAQNSLLPEEEMDGFYNEQVVKNTRVWYRNRDRATFSSQ